MSLRLTLAAALLCCSVGSVAAQTAQTRRTIDASRALDAGANSVEAQDILPTATPPDPAPLVERNQWVFDLFWDRGDVRLASVRARALPAPQATARSMGRFALELFEGPTLIERLRFDFPLLGSVEPDAGSISFTRRLRTRVAVEFPAPSRGTALRLVDRATGRRWALAWPAAEAADGGALQALDDSGPKP